MSPKKCPENVRDITHNNMTVYPHREKKSKLRISVYERERKNEVEMQNPGELLYLSKILTQGIEKRSIIFLVLELLDYEAFLRVFFGYLLDFRDY